MQANPEFVHSRSELGEVCALLPQEDLLSADLHVDNMIWTVRLSLFASHANCFSTAGAAAQMSRMDAASRLTIVRDITFATVNIVATPEFRSDLWLVSSAILLNPNVTQDVAEEIQNREDVIIIIFL